MIKDTELRKGNWFWNAHSCMFDRLQYIIPKDSPLNGLFGVKMVGYHNLIDLEALEAIPLTPEILSMCNLENVSIYKFKNIGGNPFWFYFHKNIFHIGTGNGPNSMQHTQLLSFKNISVHRFQNLYLDLTGEELEINSNEQIHRQINSLEA